MAPMAIALARMQMPHVKVFQVDRSPPVVSAFLRHIDILSGIMCFPQVIEARVHRYPGQFSGPDLGNIMWAVASLRIPVCAMSVALSVLIVHRLRPLFHRLQGLFDPTDSLDGRCTDSFRTLCLR